MDLKTWLMFVLTETALCLSPGPAVLLVLSQGLSRGPRASVWANVGILTGNAIYFVLSAAGLGAVLLASHQLFEIVKWAGAAYLIWLGGAAILGRSAPLPIGTARGPVVAGPRLLLRGLVLQLANPKALLFFTALLPQFLNPAHDLKLQVATLALTSMSIEFLVLLAYGAAAGRMSAFTTRPRVSAWVNRLCGGMLIAAGASVAATIR